MSTLVNPALGRSSGAFTLAACTVSGSGVVTPGTAKPFTGQLLEFDLTETNEVENISASTSRNGNEVIIETINNLSLSGFLFAADSVATPTNPLWAIAQVADYVQFVGSWAGRSCTFIGVMKVYKEGLVNKGKMPFSMEIGFPDIGSANPLFA